MYIWRKCKYGERCIHGERCIYGERCIERGVRDTMDLVIDSRLVRTTAHQLCPEETIVFELMTSDRKLKASREGSK